MSSSFDVVVIGGGVVGLSAALSMHQRGYSVALFDASDGAVVSRVYAINQASIALFTALGIWPLMDKTRVPSYEKIHVWDAASGGAIDFDARMIGRSHLGFILEEASIKDALWVEIRKKDIDAFKKTRMTSVTLAEDGVIISDGTSEWHGKLMIVADGARSAMRDLLNVAVTGWPYHQEALVTTVATEKPHLSTAYQVFHQTGPLAFLPLADGHQCSIVWSAAPTTVKTLMALSDAPFEQALAKAFEEKLGSCQLIGNRSRFPLSMRHAKVYSGRHWLLMGDAAHTIHPLTGLGLNLGLADLTSWLALLDAAKTPVFSTKMLGAYQRERKHAVWTLIALIEGLKAFFANPLPPVTFLRGVLLNACDQLPPLKRFFIKQATGSDIFDKGVVPD